MFRLTSKSVTLLRASSVASANANRTVASLTSRKGNSSNSSNSGSQSKRLFYGAAAVGGAAVATSTVVYADKSKQTNHALIVEGGDVVHTYEENGVTYAIKYTKNTVSEPYVYNGEGSAPALSGGAVAELPTDVYEPTEADKLSLLKDVVSSVRKIEAQLGVRPGAGQETTSGFPDFPASCKSLLKKHLSRDVYEKIKDRATPSGFTLDHAIQSGVDNPDSGVGLYAGDEASYTVFGPLFDAVIEDYHGGYKPTDTHVSDLDVSKLKGNLAEAGDAVVSTRIRVGRNIRGLGLSPGIKRAERREVERIVTKALNNMKGDLAGKYYSLSSMSEDDRKQLVDDHFLFKKGDRFLQSAGANRDWPESRGIFHNKEKTFLVWLNEEDQMRIISMEKGGDVVKIFDRLVRAIDAIEEEVKAAGYEFMHNDHLGYIHSCPTNCGTGMRASVHVSLPNASKHPEFKKWCEKLRLQPRGIHGEHSETEGGVFDISNKERLGKSEVQLVQTMIDGVLALLEADKALAAGEDKEKVSKSILGTQ